MKGLCTNCEKRETCKHLCKKAEDYANQDHVSQRELPINPRTLDSGAPGGMWDLAVDQTPLTHKEKIIVTLLGHNIERKLICELLDISRVTLRKHIHRIRDKISE
jgi:ATP/maltotriose-dependent transcriptional regulator MalT